MSTVAVNRVAWDAHLRDLRHLEARAASALADWLEYLTVEGKAAGTLYQYTRQVAPLLRAFPGKELHEITAADINHVLGRVPERSRYITRSIYNAWFSWAEGEEVVVADEDGEPVLNDDGRPVMRPLLTHQPMRRVPKMRQPHRRPRDIYSEVEVEKLASLGFPYGQLARLMFGTGLRRGECRSLRRSDVNLDRARLMVYHGKGDKDRIVGLPESVQAAFIDLHTLGDLQPDECYWGLSRNRRYQSRYWRLRPISNSQFDRWWHDAVELAGVRYLNPHQTRHTYGHWLREQHLDLEERQKAMGHERSSTTERYYGRVTEEDVAQKIAELA